MAYFVLTSYTTPKEKLDVFDLDQDAFESIGTVKPGYEHKLTQVPSTTDFSSVPISNKTRYVAVLRSVPNGYKIIQEGLIGSVNFMRGDSGFEVFGPDGQIVYAGEPGDCPDVFPPEIFGLKSHVWWEVLKT